TRTIPPLRRDTQKWYSKWLCWRKTRSRCDPCVAMMEPAELRHRDDAAHRRRLDIASHRRVAPERHVGAVRVVIRNICTKNPTQVVFAENDHVVDDLPTRGADPSLREPVLPRGPGRDSQLGKAEVVDPAVERGAEDLVAIADQSRHP